MGAGGNVIQHKQLKCVACSKLFGILDSEATHLCHDCQKPLCNKCNIYHKEFNQKHNVTPLEGMRMDEVLKVMKADICPLHLKPKGSRCDLCKVDALCDMCHSIDSPGCPSRPLSMGEGTLKQHSQITTLTREIDRLASSLRKRNEKMRGHTDELSSDCDSTCKQLTQDFEEMMTIARDKIEELCKDMSQMTTEQKKRWRHLLGENEDILKELDVWINQHSKYKSQQNVADVISDLQSLRAKLSSRLDKSVGVEEKCLLEVTFSDWWLQIIKRLKNETIGSVSLKVELPPKNFKFEKNINLRGSNSDITSIHVSDENNHVFVSHYKNQSVIEFTEQGEMICECQLFDGEDKCAPWDMSSISPDLFAVACGLERKIFFLEKRKNPSLQIEKIITTNNEFLSLCEMKNIIFACDDYFQVDSFTKGGEKIKNILAGGSKGGIWPRIRADPSTGTLWGTTLDSCEIFSFSPNGEKLRSVKTGEKITDFYVEEFGNFYISNYEGIFSFSQKNIYYTFGKKSEYHSRIFAFRNRLFICFRIDGEYLIKMFNEVQPKQKEINSECTDGGKIEECLSQPLPVGEGSSKPETEKGPTPAKEMDDLEIEKDRISISSLKEETLSPPKNLVFENKLNIIKTGESWGSGWPRIRADPSTGNLWMTRINSSSELFSFDLNGNNLQSVKIDEIISDFCFDEFGHFYFCNQEGIFSFFPKKLLHKFPKRSTKKETCLFVFKNKLFVSLRIKGKDVIKIFKISY